MAQSVGRPLKFKSVEELEKKINAYFEDKKNKPYTITDLAVWLDCDRQTLLNYQEKEEFFGTIKKAKTRIEASIEKGALSGLYNPTFSIFNMKNNFGWKDKQEIKSEIKTPKIELEITDNSDLEKTLYEGGDNNGKEKTDK